MEALKRMLSISLSWRDVYVWLIFLLAFLIQIAKGFNLDVEIPLFKYGPDKSYFGFAVAQHFIGDEPFVLVGAPKDSGLDENNETGAFYSCKFNTYPNKLTNDREDSRWCKKAVLEQLPPNYGLLTQNEEERWTIKSDAGYYNITGHEYSHSWFGATIGASPARPRGDNRVLVCAPTLLLEVGAYTDGSCFLLNNNLHQIGAPLRDCKNEDRKERHNSYGVCEQGFSAVLSEKYETIVTGLPGVMKWTGGAVARDLNDVANYRDTKRRTGVGAVEKSLKSHSYFGYSVNVGRFGFPYESKKNNGRAVYTLVFGSPRHNDTGGVFFSKFNKDQRSVPINQINDLKILPDFYLNGDHLIASGFGYTVAVGDINNDGFDDLLVGAPYYFNASSTVQRGGAVFIYFASGQAKSDNFNDVFLPPVKLFGPIGSNFGISIAFLGDINEDNFQDFAIGAPFTEQGGTIFVYLGGRRQDFINATVSPIQVIHGANISSKASKPIKSFGWSLAGGTDLDNNGYPDLVVGAFMSNTAVVLRTRPIIHVKTGVLESDLIPVDRDTMTCRDGSNDICFSFHTLLNVTRSKGYNTDLSTNLFKCRLEIVHYETAPKRAFFISGPPTVREWHCGRGADVSPQKERHYFRLSKDNSDWLNPLKFRFSVILTPEPRRAPSQGEQLPSLSRHPILDKRGAEHMFVLPFNKKCGSDNDCWSDLRLICQTTTPKGDKIYVKQSGTGRTLDLIYKITNGGERAYESILNISYDSDDIEDVELLDYSRVRLKTAPGENPAIIALGNPLQENESVTFTIQFTISQSKAGGLLNPLRFTSQAMSSSKELNPDDNVCIGDVKVIKQVDAQLGGRSESTSKILYYGGKVVGESAMKHVDDIGQEVSHVYTVQNKGPWVINSARVIVDFPYETRSWKERGKWALYVTAQPQVEVSVPGERLRILHTCRVEDSEGVNPLNLTVGETITNGLWSEKSKTLTKRSPNYDKSNSLDAGQDEDGSHKRVLGRFNRELRVKPRPVPGSKTFYVRISCEGDESQRTANCLRIQCYLANLQVNSSASVRIKASLWNSTFIEDYRDVEYVELVSKGRLLLDSTQAIELLDPSQGSFYVETRAQPDIPSIPIKRHVPIWIIILAVVGGIFLLFLITMLFWKCGFFERRRDPHQPLYKAEYKHSEDFDDN